ncbi:hypothetical protein CIG75_17215 [Tumebacillus algifaecis]|uniref:Uncharacterized protein n=1 Tax=Tumebacillus algifaecis TaxID=1214604 RepID=A0A223D523_9BACL|nr:hypothetical protein [Tumebacillus algifaecis]ASS76526.1 hypothetical protein CIG75_17215 [Tumebacillus algifaecis]
MLSFTGFLLISIGLFALFYVWYWAVHRNGVPNAAQAEAGDRRTHDDTHRKRSKVWPRNVAMVEFGSFDEPEDAKRTAERQITDPHRLLSAPKSEAPRDSK